MNKNLFVPNTKVCLGNFKKYPFEKDRDITG